MTREEVLQQIQQIGTCEDETARRDLLATLQEGITADYDNHATILAERDRLTGDNERLREANMKLFLRIGDPEKKKQDPGQPAEKLKFENLFNEKGELK